MHASVGERALDVRAHPEDDPDLAASHIGVAQRHDERRQRSWVASLYWAEIDSDESALGDGKGQRLPESLGVPAPERMRNGYYRRAAVEPDLEDALPLTVAH